MTSELLTSTEKAFVYAARALAALVEAGAPSSNVSTERPRFGHGDYSTGSHLEIHADASCTLVIDRNHYNPVAMVKIVELARELLYSERWHQVHTNAGVEWRLHSCEGLRRGAENIGKERAGASEG